jgi:hypothetical protein
MFIDRYDGSCEPYYEEQWHREEIEYWLDHLSFEALGDVITACANYGSNEAPVFEILGAAFAGPKQVELRQKMIDKFRDWLVTYLMADEDYLNELVGRLK